MKSIYYLYMLACLCFITQVTNAQIHEVMIGHPVPIISTKNIINYNKPDFNIRDFKGKLLILDFWATYCAPCVAMFPKTDSLEKSFDGRVRFISVSKETGSKVNSFLKHIETVRHIKPTSIYSDTVLSRMFYFSNIPYYVWINVDGKVIAMTGAEEVTKENIESILAGKKPKFNNVTDIRRRAINIQNRLYNISNNFLNKNEADDTISKMATFGYTIASKYIDRAKNGKLVFDPNRFSAYNISIDLLFRWAYDDTYYPLPVHGAFDTRITYQFDIKKELHDKITLPDDGSIKDGTMEEEKWAHDNAVCFEVFYPKNLSWDEKRKLVRDELDKYFAKPMGFTVSVQRRLDSSTMQLLRVDTTKNKLNPSTSKIEFTQDRYSYVQRNRSLDYLAALLNEHYFQGKKIYFINKTGIQMPVDIDLKCDMTDLNSINAELKRYNLVFRKIPTQVNVLVFSDEKH